MNFVGNVTKKKWSKTGIQKWNLRLLKRLFGKNNERETQATRTAAKNK